MDNCSIKYWWIFFAIRQLSAGKIGNIGTEKPNELVLTKYKAKCMQELETIRNFKPLAQMILCKNKREYFFLKLCLVLVLFTSF